MTVIVSLDCEANGLHGDIFAVAAAVYEDGREIETWTARCPIYGQVDPWVETNVLPALVDMPVTEQSYAALVHGWRVHYRQWRDEFGPEMRVLCHVPWPIETRLLWDAHHDVPFSGPFPLLDLASMLHAIGHDPTSEDAYLAAIGIRRPTGMPHDPLNDVRTAALAYFALTGGRTS
jgi:hypothetical protein